MMVIVERHVEQVRDGEHYKGYVKIADTKLDYELVLGVPIPKLDDLELPRTREDVRRIFQITVTRDGGNIELTNEEYGFFFSLIAQLAIEFYYNPQTRDNQRGMMGELLNGRGLLADFGASASIGVTGSSRYDFNPELCEMLSAPKFGCQLVT